MKLLKKLEKTPVECRALVRVFSVAQRLSQWCVHREGLGKDGLLRRHRRDRTAVSGACKSLLQIARNFSIVIRRSRKNPRCESPAQFQRGAAAGRDLAGHFTVISRIEDDGHT